MFMMVDLYETFIAAARNLCMSVIDIIILPLNKKKFPREKSVQVVHENGPRLGRYGPLGPLGPLMGPLHSKGKCS